MINNYITPNLYITRDESPIIDLLVDHQEMPTDFENSHVRSFYHGRDFHLALYFPDKKDRGFHMYVVQDFSLHVDDLIILRKIFAELINDGYDFHILKKAHDCTDNMVHMAKTFRAMLNPGLPDSSEDDVN